MSIGFGHMRAGRRDQHHCTLCLAQRIFRVFDEHESGGPIGGEPVATLTECGVFEQPKRLMPALYTIAASRPWLCKLVVISSWMYAAMTIRRRGVTVNVRRNPIGGHFVLVRHDYSPAVSGEPLRCGGTDAVARAGDDNDRLRLRILCHRFLPLSIAMHAAVSVFSEEQDVGATQLIDRGHPPNQ